MVMLNRATHGIYKAADKQKTGIRSGAMTHTEEGALHFLLTEG